MYANNGTRKINICHVTSAHSRYDVRIFHKECKSLAKNGFDVTLLVNDNIDDELIEGVKIKSTNFKPKNRYERMIISQKKVREKAIQINADIYHLHDPELLPLASYLKKKSKKVIFDFHEDVSQQILFKKWIPKSIRKVISISYSIYEAQNAKKFDALITVTPKIVERLKKINPQTIMITNYPILSNFYTEDVITKNNMLCFAGGVTPQWNHLNIIKAIEGIEDITYSLAGTGSEEYINSLKKLDGWNKVKYLGKIPHEEVRGVYSKSLFGMALLSFNTQVGNEGTLGNTKIFEFMEAGLPIICSNNNLWKEIVKEYKCGIAVDPNNVQEIVNAIRIILDNPEKADKMGANGRRAIVEKFNWRTQESVLLDLYSSLI